MRRILWQRGKPVTRRLLMLMVSGMLLSGCASKPIEPAVSCPEPTPLPVQLKEQSSPKVQASSKDWLETLELARDWLQSLPLTKTP